MKIPAVLAISGTLCAAPLLAGPALKCVEPVVPKSWTEAELSSSFVLSSDFERGAGRYGAQSAAHSEFTVKHRIPLDAHWHLVLGAGYGRFDFGSGQAPLPSHLQETAAVLGLEYRKGPNVGFLFETRPGVYFANAITASAFDAPTILAVAYEVTDRFVVMGGASFSALRKFPVLPLAGALWRINDRWTLDLILPDPQLVFQATDALEVWVGGRMTGGAYRTDHRTIEPPELDGAVVTYYEMRAEAGLRWKPCRGGTVELAGGYVFARAFDYHRAGEKYELEGAPGFGLKVALTF